MRTVVANCTVTAGMRSPALSPRFNLSRSLVVCIVPLLRAMNHVGREDRYFFFCYARAAHRSRDIPRARLAYNAPRSLFVSLVDVRGKRARVHL